MSQIKKAFISRYPEGFLLNGDLSAIEMVWFAQLSRDYTLSNLIKSGIDIHKYMYNKVYGVPMDIITDNQRNSVKRVVFGIIYGNAAKTASINSGLAEEECQQIIDEFYNAFPNTKIWQNYNIKQVDKAGVLKMPTNILLKFKRVIYINNKKTVYNPEIHTTKFLLQNKLRPQYAKPDIKNYPVQHMAAVTMLLILGKFFREKALYNRDKYLMINTVHDSIMLDCSSEPCTNLAEKDIEEIICKIPDYMLNLWNIKMNVPIKMKYSRGKTWYDLK